jgi:cation diffusion facilitator family transporter
MSATSKAERVALAALAVTIALTITKLIVWRVTGSIAVLSQALDSALDIVALSLVFLGVRIAGKPADASHHYGHAKAENLAAFTQTLILLAIVAYVALEAARRLVGEPAEVVVPWYALALFAGSVPVDGVRVWFLTRAARTERSDALAAGALNLATDIGTALLALVSLTFVRFGVERADAVGGLLVAALVAFAAIRLGKRSGDVLMDRAPRFPIERIEAAAAAASGVSGTRRVRVRGTPKQIFADVTVTAGRTASLERAHDIADAVESEIRRAVPGTDVVVHVEPASETGGMVERVQAAASRIDGVYEVHNVLVHAFDEAGRSKLHVTLHAKSRSGISVEDAHALADRIEAAVDEELDQEARVDAHIEPLVPTSFGRDVTDERRDIVEAVRRRSVEEPDVLDCHEVLVTSSDGRLSVTAHVHARGDLSLSRLHEASDRIEKTLHAEHDEIGSVVIHFEPTDR